MSTVRRKVYLGCAAGFAVGAALSDPIAHLLAIRSTGGLVETFGAGALWTIACFERALLQARQAYPAYADEPACWRACCAARRPWRSSEPGSAFRARLPDC